VGPAWRIIVLALAVLAGVSLTACESSQDKARKLREQAVAAAPKPLVISHPYRDVKVLDSALLHDQYGDAIAVELKNESNKTLVDVPILVDLRDSKGKSVYKNDAAGSEPALNHVALMKPGETFTWVNDQLKPDRLAKSAKVTIGPPEGKAPAKLPELVVSTPRTSNDISGTKVSGTVTNKSQIDQTQLTLFAVARQGGRIVAAGRGAIKKLKVGAAPGSYVIFFIGNPAGADVTVEAPPVTLVQRGTQ
jgi:hypothetical protein